MFTRVAPGKEFPERSYEQPDAYRVRGVADRLPLALIRRYLLGAGVPVDDPQYMTGPVTTMSLPSRIESDLTWADMTQLRAAAGYRQDGIETDLRAAPNLPVDT